MVNSYTSLENWIRRSLMKTLYADLPLVEGEAHIVDFDLATLKENDIPF
jgi:cell division transport system ATP-binding protein